MTETPETHYAKSGDFHIAYQLAGSGPIDLLIALGIPLSIDTLWDAPASAQLLHRLTAFSRVILFDRRGVGLSDPFTVSEPPTLEQWTEDAVAVLDAVASKPVAVFGADSTGGQMSLLLAATYPSLVSAAVVFNSTARRAPSDGYPEGTVSPAASLPPDANAAQWLASDEMLHLLAPSAVGDPAFREWWKRSIHRSVSPAMARATVEIRDASDIRAILGTIRTPTLVLCRAGSRFYSVEHSRYIAEHVPSARYVELAGADHLPYTGDQDAVIDEIQEFVTGVRPIPEPDRVLATVLFTDIVESTHRASEIGDRRWRALLGQHDAMINRHLDRFGGRRVHGVGQGDGVLATFEGPARTIRCAQAIVDGVRVLGLDVRCGLHTGEIERSPDDIGGIAVHIAARVMAQAGPGEVVVSSTVKDLVAGSGIVFADRGTQKLKGVPDEWRLYAVEG